MVPERPVFREIPGAVNYDDILRLYDLARHCSIDADHLANNYPGQPESRSAPELAGFAAMIDGVLRARPQAEILRATLDAMTPIQERLDAHRARQEADLARWDAEAKLARTARCPLCDAEPGRDCVTSAGKRTGVHRARIATAELAELDR